MPSQLLIDYLQRCGAQFQLLTHPPAYTAVDAAASANILLSHYAKVVMVKLDRELAMIIAPAAEPVSLTRISDTGVARRVELVREGEFRRCFPRCEAGAMPPFGHLFGLRALLLPLFDDDGDIVFNAGSHTESIRMSCLEFKFLAHADELDLRPAEDFPIPDLPPMRSRMMAG